MKSNGSGECTTTRPHHNMKPQTERLHYKTLLLSFLLRSAQVLKYSELPIRAHRAHQEAGLKDTGALTEHFRQRVNTDGQKEEK